MGKNATNNETPTTQSKSYFILLVPLLRMENFSPDISATHYVKYARVRKKLENTDQRNPFY